jgi:hypothetical protein
MTIRKPIKDKINPTKTVETRNKVLSKSKVVSKSATVKAKPLVTKSSTTNIKKPTQKKRYYSFSKTSCKKFKSY